MNTDFLEKLLIDRQLNELPPETTALLDAYLTDHPEMQPLADSIKETVDTGQSALHVELPRKLPPFPKERMLSRTRSAGRITVRQWISVAASLLIGIGLGISAMQLKVQPPPNFPDITATIPSQPNPEGFESARAFWSHNTYIDRYQKTRKDRAQRKGNTKSQQQIQNFKKRGLL